MSVSMKPPSFAAAARASISSFFFSSAATLALSFLTRDETELTELSSETLEEGR